MLLTMSNECIRENYVRMVIFSRKKSVGSLKEQEILLTISIKTQIVFFFLNVIYFTVEFRAK